MSSPVSLQALIHQLQQARADEAWDSIAALDDQVRQQVEQHMAGSPDQALQAELQALCDLYRELIDERTAHRSDIAGQIQQVSKTRRALHSYLDHRK